MNKQEFIETLRKKLSGLPKNEIEERVSFYSEIIEDKIEEGILEEQAVTEIGNIDDIVSEIIKDIPLIKIAKEKLKPKNKFSAIEITLIALGSPIWFSLIVSALAVIFSLYVAFWSVVISFWAAFISLIASGGAGIITGFTLIFIGNSIQGLALVGASIFLAGLSIFIFYGVSALSKYYVLLTKNIVLGVKNRLLKKEVA